MIFASNDVHYDTPNQIYFSEYVHKMQTLYLPVTNIVQPYQSQIQQENSVHTDCGQNVLYT